MTTLCEDEVKMKRDRFASFVATRNWKFSEGYWSRTIKYCCNTLPDFVEGDQSLNGFGVSNLTPIREAGEKGEFTSKNSRYQQKQTFALRVGYDGNAYHGYQKQKYCPGLTVEDDLTTALGRNTIGAGRTDRGVSGVSQVICFAVQDTKITADEFVSKFKESVPYQEGRLAVYDCQKVPKKFHSRASATWRRYLYMFPLNRVDEAAQEIGVQGVYACSQDTALGNTKKYDVDVEYLNQVFARLEGKELPYNAFAFKEDRNTGLGMLDRCLLYKVRATVVNLAECAPGVAWGPTPTPVPVDPGTLKKRKWMGTEQEEQGEEGVSVPQPAEGGDEAEQESSPAAPATTASSSGFHPGPDATTVVVPPGSEVPALCIELVGNRFLRRMVRILTATAIREATIAPAERNVNILVDICNSGDRELASRPLPGSPLCLAGVGYDHHDLAIYKFMPKIEYNARMAERPPPQQSAEQQQCVGQVDEQKVKREEQQEEVIMQE